MPRPKKPAATSPTTSEAAPPTDLATIPFPQRVEQTIKWLLTGARDADVLEAIATAWPDQELQPLIAEAVSMLADAGDCDRLVVRGWCVEATKDLYRRMVEIGDFAGALRAVKTLADLAA